MDIKTIFATIGFIFIILYAFWFIMNRMKEKQDNVVTNNIPANYMQEVGLHCPDYYINNVNNDTISSCKNSYNLRQSMDANGMSTIPNCSGVKCYQNKHNKTVHFNMIKNWDTMNDSQRTEAVNNKGNGTLSRCDWIRCCGPKLGDKYTQQPWVEIQNYCTN